MTAVVIVVAVVALAGFGLAVAFVAVVLGIQMTERRQGLPGPPRGCTDAFARRVLGARVCQQAAPRRSCRAARSQGRRVAGHAR